PIQMVRLLRGLWEAVGDRLGLSMYLLDAALAWRDLGNHELARKCLEEAEALAGDHSPSRKALGLALRGTVVREAGDLAGSAAAFAEAGERFRALQHQAGLFLVDFGRAELLLRQGDVSGGRARLEELTGHPIVQARSGLQVGLLLSRLRAAATAGDQAGVR